MSCSVLTCKNTNRGPKRPLGFYTFPKDRDLYEKWVMFCRRGAVPKSARVCGEHFRPEDFERNVKCALGYTKHNALKPGAIPTIFTKDVSPATAAQQRFDALRAQKEMVANMLKEAGCAVKTETFNNSLHTICEPDLSCYIKEEICQPDLSCYIKEEICQPDLSSYIKEEICQPDLSSYIKEEIYQPDLSCYKVCEPGFSSPPSQKQYESRIAELEQKVVDLKRDNFKLTLEAEKRDKEISLLQKRIDKMAADSQLLDQHLLNMFTPTQLHIIKNGNKKVSGWDEGDIARANAIYKKSMTAYKVLKEMNFPIPSIRSLQRAAQNKAEKTEDGESNYNT